MLYSVQSPCARRLSTHRAFTLVELLVTISIIGILVGLLLPAVQAAREAARKSQCMNHCRQIGLALQNYQSALRTMPIGCHEWRPYRGNPKLKNLAWSAMLLPFMEQNSLHSLVNFSLPFDHPANAQAAQTTIPIYQCPTVPTRDKPLGRIDYGGLYGQRITTRTNTDNGVLIYNRPVHLREITDGLSNTLVAAEDTDGPDCQWINGSNVFEQSGAINDPLAWKGDNEIRSRHVGGAMVLFSCTRTQFLSSSIDKLTLAALITRSEGEVIQGEILQ